MDAQAVAVSGSLFNVRPKAIKEISRPSVDMPISINWWPYDDRWARLPPTEIVDSPVGHELPPHSLARRTFLLELDGVETIAHFYDLQDCHWRESHFAKIDSPYLAPTEIIELDDERLIGTTREYRGNPLTDYLEILAVTPEEGPDLSWRLEVLNSVLEGLHYLHSRDLTHGDLRPDNIIIGDRGVQLVDYGFAIPRQLLTLDQTAYRAPETRNGAKPYAFSDMYAFARLAQRMLGGFLWRTPGEQTERSWAISLAVDVASSFVPARRIDASSMARVLGTERLADLVDTQPISTVARILRDRKRSLTGARRLQQEFLQHPGLTLATKTSDDAARLASFLDKPPRATVDKPLTDSSDLFTIRALDKSHLPTSDEIDSRWKEVAHKRFFGYGIAGGHEGRLRRLPLLSAERRKIRQFDEYVRQLSLVRAEMLDTIPFIDEDEALSALSGTARASAADTDLTALRHIKAVLFVPDYGRQLYPRFQFSSNGLVSPLIQDVSLTMGASTEWEVLAWWYLPRTLVDGKSLADVLYLPEGSAAINRALDVMREGRDIAS